MTDWSRRVFLGSSALAALAGAGAAAGRAGDKGKAEPGKEKGEEKEIPTFRFAFDAQPPKKVKGKNNSKEVTVRELPISTGMAGVSMRLEPGGMRELHWHTASEWAYVLKGRVRTTVIGPDATSETNDFGPGDVWFFPPGHAHALQGLGPGECHFILVFNDGHFSENSTFSITDWIAHTPREVVAKVLDLPEEDLKRLPKGEVYFARGPVPPAGKQLPLSGVLKAPRLTHKFRLGAQDPVFHTRGGTERRATVVEFPISTTTAGVLLELAPGSVREPHWHPNADEWQFLISGQVRIGAFGARGRSRVEHFNPGDAGYVPRMFGHWIENTSATEPARLLIVFNNGDYQAIDLSWWIASNPAYLLAENFGVPEEVVKKLPRKRQFIVNRKGRA